MPGGQAAGAVRRSWGLYPPAAQTPHRVSWRDGIHRTLLALHRECGTTLPYGNGRSYGDSCMAASDHVLETRLLDRIVSADWQTGVVAAEAGMTLGELLALAVPRGWFLPVTPGTQHVTLGGAVANDVHGKNHHVRGTFGRHVRRFGLTRSDEADIVCSPDSRPELFTSTIGGLGLTGVIGWVELGLVPITSSMMETVSVRFGSLDEFFALSRELDARHEYTVSWIDCLAKDRASGRGVFHAGDHAQNGPLRVSTNRQLVVPFTLPVSPINRLTLRTFNAIHYAWQPSKRRFVTRYYEPFFYPLDRLLHWNRLYGRRGFQQFQCVIPEAAAPDAIAALLDAISRHGQGSFLAVLKRCGDLPSPGVLSFPISGTSLALDFAQHDRLEPVVFARLDAIVREAGGRLYPAKDAHMSGEDFRRAYPAWPQVESLRDPAICSKFWRRVTTT
ncbi:MAG: FAD-binding protein [Lautropia sp.]